MSVKVPGISAPLGVWTMSPICVQEAGSIALLKVTVIVGRAPTRSLLMAGSTDVTLGRSVSSTMLAETGAEATPAAFSTFAQSVFVPSPSGNVQEEAAWYGCHGCHVVPSELNAIRAGPERLPDAANEMGTVVLFVRARPAPSCERRDRRSILDDLDYQRVRPHDGASPS